MELTGRAWLGEQGAAKPESTAPQHHPLLPSLTRNGAGAGGLNCDQDRSLQGARAAGHLTRVLARVSRGHLVQPQQGAVGLSRLGRE